MLRRVKELHGVKLRARDGEIGSVDEILFDDNQWIVRYLVVNTGGWLNERKVLIAPKAFGDMNWTTREWHVNLTHHQVEDSPGIDMDAPVSRQMETEYYDHYGWPYYWTGMGLANRAGLSWAAGNPGSVYSVTTAINAASPQALEARARGGDNPDKNDDIHLRSSREVTGYGIVAEDGHIGHVEDLIIDEVSWLIRYLAVDTRDWWPGKKVLLPPEWIISTQWPDRSVNVGVTRVQVRNGPSWNAHEPISPAFEYELAVYYGEQRLEVDERPVAHRNERQASAGRSYSERQ
ncbi:hypothetical protein CCAX7_61550 [Capsulimonas corticalis]|uniref:Uncharacterized protein n=1 Tax=Capsulimonas corticalis TaxID=2219043 RepID=A0A402CWB3_9BACT|nr:PRC-barrel domain-containing protein [Capsulimonas corticalis]BDI34104.1 hypothetical protein CCAX7_61550 [Capsulimonas corticalis]